MQIALAIDTTTPVPSASIAVGEDVYTACLREGSSRVVEKFPAMVSTLAQEASVALHDVRAVYVSLGPASFTGVRTGISFCEGMRAALGIPVTGVGTMDVLAFAYREEGAESLLLRATSREFYMQKFHMDRDMPESTSEIEILQLADFSLSGKFIAVGFDEAQRDTIPSKEGRFHDFPPLSPYILQACCNKTTHSLPIVPIYVRPADAKKRASQITIL